MYRLTAIIITCAALGACHDRQPRRTQTVVILPDGAPPSAPSTRAAEPQAPPSEPASAFQSEPPDLRGALRVDPAPEPTPVGMPDAGTPDAAPDAEAPPACVPDIERCDGTDDDCDGAIDEDFAIGQPCSRGQGVCAASGEMICTRDGRGTACTADPGPADVERCDALDNDCDGVVDEAGDAATGNACGGCGPTPAETCNGEDDDCDGAIDEGFDVGAACTVGIPSTCSGEGVRVCTADGEAVCDADAPDPLICARAERRRVATSSDSTCAVRDGAVRCWGSDRSVVGAIAVDILPMDRDALPLGMNVIALALGAQHGCALSDFGRVKCWGRVGLGDIGHPGPRDAVLLPGDAKLAALPLPGLVSDLDAAGHNTCVVGDDGSVRCWGSNVGGMLGYGHFEPIGDDVGEIEALPPVDLDLFAVQVSLGARHACALANDGRVKCWGHNDHGQLGLGDRFDRVGVPEQMGRNLRFVDLGMPVIELSAAGRHTCALGLEGQVKCWGSNATGAFDGPGLDRGAALADMGEALPSINLPEPAIAISATDGANCAVGESGRVWCWGTELRGSPAWRFRLKQMELGVPVLQVTSSGSHTCATTGDRLLRCWGSGALGALGYGDREDRDASPELPDIALEGL